MAHLENGYSPIANEWLENLAKTKLSPNEFRLLMVVFRHIYGFRGRRWARISMRFYEKATGIDFRECAKVEKRLRDRNIIIRDGARVKLQKYAEKWESVGVKPDDQAKIDKLRSRDDNKNDESVGGKPDGVENEKNPSGANPTKRRGQTRQRNKKRNKPIKNSPTSKKSAKKSKRRKPIDPINFEVVDLLFNGIRKSVPGKADLTTQRRQSWAEQIDRFFRLDKVDHSEMVRVIRWLYGPNLKRSTPFNVQSPESLRRKWDNIVFSMKAYSTDDLQSVIEKQWRIVFDVSCRIGRSGSWGIKDPITRKVVQIMTPSSFCNMTKRNIGNVKSQFADLYRREHERRGRE